MPSLHEAEKILEDAAFLQNCHQFMHFYRRSGRHCTIYSNPWQGNLDAACTATAHIWQHAMIACSSASCYRHNYITRSPAVQRGLVLAIPTVLRQHSGMLYEGHFWSSSRLAKAQGFSQSHVTQYMTELSSCNPCNLKTLLGHDLSFT